ncbi:MAG: dipeptidase [Ignavibacteria bacterium]|nr:dipeptidase [Ignavibacteria bacterium]
MNPALKWLSDSYETMLLELTEYLSIPSISTDPLHANDVVLCAEWIEAHLKKIGMPLVEIHPTDRHPIVYAEFTGAGPKKPTLLLYGHYDVQPVDPIELWTTDPFKAIVRDDKIFARGATDDKGQFFAHIKALESIIATSGSLPLNIKIIIEGEEEIGSPNLFSFVRANAEKLSADAVAVSDSSMIGPGKPSILTGLRGLCYLQVTVVGPNRDLHSGSYGGPVVNPLNALCSIVASLKDSSGRIAVTGFYDDVTDATQEERESFEKLGYSPEVLMKDINVGALNGEAGYSPLEQLWIRPSLDLNGILGGFTGEGAKTVLPSHAMAKISMRLVPHQRHDDVVEKVREFIHTAAAPGVSVTVTDLHGANPVLVPVNSVAVQSASKALEETFGVPCVFHREGGSIPVVELFDSVLNIPTVLMGFGLKTENLHSPNEHFHLENFRRGMQSAVRFYHHYAKASTL